MERRRASSQCGAIPIYITLPATLVIPSPPSAMPRFLDKLFDKGKGNQSHHPNAPPPQWTPAAEQSHTHGKYHEATDNEYKEAQLFCARVPVERPKLLSSDMVERLSQEGCKPWEMVLPSSPRFRGCVESGIDKGGAGVTKVVTDQKCEDVCLFSNLPIMAGLYDTKGKQGVYYEVVVREMVGFIAIGNSYPAPGYDPC